MKKPICYHRIEVILESATARGYVMIKCLDCPYYHWVLPGVTAIGNMWRCWECREPFKVDRAAAKQLKPVCIMCDLKAGKIDRFLEATNEKAKEADRVRELERIKALDEQDLEEIEGNDDGDA